MKNDTLWQLFNNEPNPSIVTDYRYSILKFKSIK